MNLLHHIPDPLSAADLGQPEGPSLPEVVAHEERRRWVRLPVVLATAGAIGAGALALSARSGKVWKQGATYGAGAAAGWLVLVAALTALGARDGA